MNPTPSGRSLSVCEDWRRWLAGCKNEAFRACRADLECSYSMLSVSLNEAIDLMHCGCFHKARQAVGVTPGLCGRLSLGLTALLHQMGEHARYYGTVPNAVPLDPANFRGPREQRVARVNSLFSRVLLTQRSQFLYKLKTLEEMVGQLQADFCASVEELTSCEPADPATLWISLDSNHFDLNTCLQETIVLLKSFFVILPEKYVPVFEGSVRALRERHSFSHRRRFHVIRARRPVELAGQ